MSSCVLWLDWRLLYKCWFLRIVSRQKTRVGCPLFVHGCSKEALIYSSLSASASRFHGVDTQYVFIILYRTLCFKLSGSMRSSLQTGIHCWLSYVTFLTTKTLEVPTPPTWALSTHCGPRLTTHESRESYVDTQCSASQRCGRTYVLDLWRGL